MHELLGLPFSPWSEKACWALDVRHVPYRYRLYQPIVGEPALRMKTKRWHGKVTVPVLTDARGHVYDDSAKIARFADAHGEGPRLFPPEQEQRVEHWIELSERGTAAGRILALERQVEDPQALAELVPRGVPRLLRTPATKLVKLALRRTLAKYGTPRPSTDEARETLRAVLDELRSDLVGSPTTPATILGSFSFADIAASQLLGFVSPAAFGLKLGQASRRCYHDPELAREYPDLIAWRDALYEAYRPRRTTTKQ